MDDIMSKAGCRPPHWETAHNLSLCSKSEEMAKFVDQPSTATVEAFGPPCTAIENLHYRYYEQEDLNDSKYCLNLQNRCYLNFTTIYNSTEKTIFLLILL